MKEFKYGCHINIFVTVTLDLKGISPVHRYTCVYNFKS